MTADADRAKCMGKILNELCELREECDRYVRPKVEHQTWMFPIALGWLCPYRVPTPPSSLQDRATP